ncbi:MAG TPA: hypothetical protein VHX52_13265 [Steroidobacteraceae bacterium]|jgi:hypothetical protein|nr:hypothetical protein [Steroidobacteraceae bacterium]
MNGMAGEPRPESEPEPGLDGRLRRLFCETDERRPCEPPGAGSAGDMAFTARIAALVHRRRRWRQILATAGVLLAATAMAAAAAWTAPLLAPAWLDAARYGDEGLRQLAGWFASPAGWGGSLALAALILWRTRAFRR